MTIKSPEVDAAIQWDPDVDEDEPNTPLVATLVGASPKVFPPGTTPVRVMVTVQNPKSFPCLLSDANYATDPGFQSPTDSKIVAPMVVPSEGSVVVSAELSFNDPSHSAPASGTISIVARRTS